MLFFKDVMLVISISKGHINSKSRRVNINKGKLDRFLFYYNFEHRFKKRTISLIQSFYLGFFKTHSKFVYCEKCHIRQKVRFRKKKDLDNYKCGKC